MNAPFVVLTFVAVTTSETRRKQLEEYLSDRRKKIVAEKYRNFRQERGFYHHVVLSVIVTRREQSS